MYELKNGVLYQDGKPIIAMGQSYYPSFHEAKYPCPPEGDRVGEMKEDVRKMVEAGFQFLRVAAIGDVTLENDEVKVNTPFVDEMLREAARQGMATSVRLQGYVMNLRGYSDYDMRNEKDEKMEYNWSAFMRSSLFHQGILQDNRDASQALARHFDDMPNLVSYQIYNEPHYPYNGIFDYHPATLAAYQAWRKAKGLPEEQPPRRKPLKGEDPAPWVWWRLFAMQAMSDFLNNTADDVKAAAPGKETYTCMTSAPVCDKIMASGINYFDNAERMDTVGITSYSGQEGVDYYAASYQYEMTQSAAALYGKNAWTIEIDARTHMPARKLHEETYNLLAAGHKGIVYYEWRGDYPDKGTPLPDNCGFIFNDGRKTEHYDRSLDMVRFVNQYSTLIASANKIRDGVALLASDYAAAYADAYMSDDGQNAFVRQSVQAFREIRKAFYSCGFVQGRHLKDNKLNVHLLFIPCDKKWLSAEEDEQIRAFLENGGKAYYLRSHTTFGAVTPYGWWPYDAEVLNETTSEFRCNMETEDVLEKETYMPLCCFSDSHLMAGTLQGEDYHLIVICNIDPMRRKIENAVMQTPIPFAKATLLTPDGETELKTEGSAVMIPAIDEGGIIWLHK